MRGAEPRINMCGERKCHPSQADSNRSEGKGIKINVYEEKNMRTRQYNEPELRHGKQAVRVIKL